LNLRGIAQAVISYFKKSLQARYTATTVILSGVALVAVGGFLSYSIGSGLFATRLDQVVKDSARSASEVQNIFSSANATDEIGLQSIMNSIVPNLESSTTSEPRRVALLRAPGQQASVVLQSPISLDLDTAVIPEGLRATVRNTPGKVVYQSISLPVVNGEHPAVVVGSQIDIPSAGKYELYLVYDLVSAQQTLDFVQSTLVFGGAILILLIGAVAYYVSTRVVNPIRVAASAAEELAAGALDRRLTEKGEDSIANLAKSFNSMASSLQSQIGALNKLSKMQQRFVSDVSHELRTPLTTIKLSVAILDQQREELPPNALRSLDTLQSQLTRFDALLSDLLEISRYDAGAVTAEFETTDLNGVVGMALAHIEPLASSRSCDLVVDIPSGAVNAELDARRIERVLRNLLSNAIEHGEGKPIEVRVGASETAVAVTVTDHGVGMNRTELDRVFDRFWRADPSRKRTVGGTGLGLSIATEDTNIHNGWLQATSKPGEGSTFRLTLPRTQGVLFTQSPLPLTTKKAAAKKDDAS
jgi:two-component system, OmpR family, sensor histidine kinase MtrB